MILTFRDVQLRKIGISSFFALAFTFSMSISALDVRVEVRSTEVTAIYFGVSAAHEYYTSAYAQTGQCFQDQGESATGIAGSTITNSGPPNFGRGPIIFTYFGTARMRFEFFGHYQGRPCYQGDPYPPNPAVTVKVFENGVLVSETTKVLVRNAALSTHLALIPPFRSQRSS